jgi:hypothetical protein
MLSMYGRYVSDTNRDWTSYFIPPIIADNPLLVMYPLYKASSFMIKYRLTTQFPYRVLLHSLRG